MVDPIYARAWAETQGETIHVGDDTPIVIDPAYVPPDSLRQTQTDSPLLQPSNRVRPIEWGEAMTEVTRLKAELAKAVELLAPFAKEAIDWSREKNSGFTFHDTDPLDGETSIRVGHLRAAHAFLSQIEENSDAE